MEVYNYPLVSIVTVNYNGKRFLTSLFNSIKDLNYPADRIQTILVDNASNDGSRELVEQEFPWVDILGLDKNYGYAGGNNAGLKSAAGDYIALINNDCIVDRDWLTGLIKAAKNKYRDIKIGAVCSKVLFFHDYIPLRFEFENDAGGVLLKINNISAGNSQPVDKDLFRYIKLLEGFSSGAINNYDEGGTLIKESGAVMALPVPEHHNHFQIQFSLCACENTNLRITIDSPGIEKDSGNIAGIELFSGFIGEDSSVVDLGIEKNHLAFKKNLINSCGLEINKMFYARDRGSNSWDEGQFNLDEEVFSPSGSSLLVNKEMLEEVGYFDDSFFTYYEDLDLFWRARLAGWKHYFTPESIARHHHCGTGEEWSYSFSYHVIRNRLLAIYKCGWFFKFISCYFSFVFSVFSNAFFYFLGLARGRKQNRPDVRARFRVFFELFYLLPKNLKKRIRIRNNASLGDAGIKKWTIDF